MSRLIAERIRDLSEAKEDHQFPQDILGAPCFICHRRPPEAAIRGCKRVQTIKIDVETALLIAKKLDELAEIKEREKEDDQRRS